MAANEFLASEDFSLSLAKRFPWDSQITDKNIVLYSLSAPFAVPR